MNLSLCFVIISRVSVNCQKQIKCFIKCCFSFFLQCIDFLTDDSITELISPETSGHTFDILIDKGTFDAISLSADETGPTGPVSSTLSRRAYVENAHRVLAVNGSGLYIITSCNWTAEELQEEFEKSHLFSLVSEVPALNTFTFGGVKGADTVCLVFKRL